MHQVKKLFKEERKKIYNMPKMIRLCPWNSNLFIWKEKK